MNRAHLSGAQCLNIQEANIPLITDKDCFKKNPKQQNAQKQKNKNQQKKNPNPFLLSSNLSLTVALDSQSSNPIASLPESEHQFIDDEEFWSSHSSHNTG